MKQYCRICLAFDVRLYKLRDAEKRQFIERIFKQHGYNRILDENQNLCYICDALLTKSYSFIARALRAQEVLYNLMKNNDMLTAVNMLLDIDRWKNKLNYTNLSFKKLNIGSIDESEATPSIKEETEDDDIINNSHITNPSDTQYVNIDNIKPINIHTHTCMDKNTDIKEIETKLEESYVVIDTIPSKEQFHIILEENNPFDIIKEEHNPHDIIAIENNVVDVITEGDNTLNNISVGQIDNLSNSHYNYINNVSVIPETSRKHVKVGHKNKKKIHSNKQIELEAYVHDVVVIDSNSVKSNDVSDGNDEDDDKYIKRKVSKNDVTYYNPDLDTMEWEECEKLKERIRQKRKIDYKLYKKPREYVKNKPRVIRRTRREIMIEENKDMIVEGKRKRKMADFTNKKDTDSDTDECVMNKKIYKGKISSDDEYVPNSESADSECEREYPMTCEQCDSLLSSKKEHYSHYLQLHPQIKYPHGTNSLSHICEICGSRFTVKHHLTSHILTHGEKKLQCQHCPKMYHSPIQLNAHFIRVHGPKKFVCDYCDKRFPDKANMRLHIRTHTGEKPYKCHICGDAFAHNGNRLLHIRVKHQNLPYPLQAKQYQEKLMKQNQIQDKKRKRKKQRTRNSSSDDDEALVIYKNKIKKKKSRSRRSSVQESDCKMGE